MEAKRKCLPLERAEAADTFDFFKFEEKAARAFANLYHFRSDTTYLNNFDDYPVIEH